MRHAVRQLRDLLALLGQLPLQPRHAPPRGEPQRVPEPRPAAAGPRLLPPGEVVVLAQRGDTSGVAIGLHSLAIPMVAILVMAIMVAVAILMTIVVAAAILVAILVAMLVVAILVACPLQPGHPLLLVLPPGQPQHRPPQPRQLASILLRGAGQWHQHSLQPRYLRLISKLGESSLYVV